MESSRTVEMTKKVGIYMAKNHIAEMEKRLWNVADEMRANSDLKSSEYSWFLIFTFSIILVSK